MALAEVIGQNHIVKHFENAVKMGKISHAYIINGEEGSGKMSLAVNFAKALQCTERGESGTACGHCKSCSQTDSMNQPDIKYVTHEKAEIRVEEIRTQINGDIDIKPYSSKYKIYIVPDSEKMNVAAQNALLKTIEEPPEYAVIILLTTNADSFLQTILSRCVVLNIRPVKDVTIKNRLMAEHGIGDYEARVAAAFANGNPGKAVKLATSEDFKDLKKAVIGAVMSLESGGMENIAGLIKTANEFKKQIDEYFTLIRIWFRDVLMYKATGNEEMLIFQDDYREIEKMSEKCSYFDLDIILKSIDQAEHRTETNVNFDVTMEVMLLSIRDRIKATN